MTSRPPAHDSFPTPRYLPIPFSRYSRLSQTKFRDMTTNHYSPDLTYDQAIELAMSLADFERSANWPGHSFFHLERVQLLAERLDDVDKAVPSVHVAGTKGKGSTCALITSILSHAGYRVGLFTSPHLHSVCERVRIGLEPISTTDYAALIGQIWPAVESVGRDGEYGGVTFFEMLTALAMAHFRNVGADFQVLEVGMGGRLDSTNIVTPEVSVITSISLDHVAVLGDTIEKIAFAKAGIIKDGVPCVVGPQAESDAMLVFEQVTRERNSTLISAAKKFSWDMGHSDVRGQDITLTSAEGTYHLRTPLLGDYQAENVATAVATAEELIERGYEIPLEAIVAGVREVSWPGRFEVFHKDGKTIVADGAHNPYSIKRFVENLRGYVQFDDVVLVFGALGGHSAEDMLNELSILEPKIVAVHSRHPRSSHSSVVADTVRSLNMNLLMETDSVSEGLIRALEFAGVDDLILCTGSLAVVAEVIEEIHGIEPEIYENLRGPRPRTQT